MPALTSSGFSTPWHGTISATNLAVSNAKGQTLVYKCSTQIQISNKSICSHKHFTNLLKLRVNFLIIMIGS